MQCVERGTHQRQIKMSKLKCQVCILVIRVSPNIRVSPIILGISNYQGIFNYQDISNYQGISKNHNIFNYQGISNFNYKYSLSFYYMQNTMLNSNETHQCQEFEQESVRRTDFIKLPNYVIIYSDKKSTQKQARAWKRGLEIQINLLCPGVLKILLERTDH